MKKISINYILITFILLLAIVFTYLVKTNSLIDEFAIYHNKIHKLKLLDKEFDNFLLKKNLFINFDNINKKVSDFERTIEFLSKDNKASFPVEYANELKEIDKLFKEKVEAIEYFKSQSSQLLYSMHYLFDLNQIIAKRLDKKSKELVNSIMLEFMKFYINPTISTKYIEDNIKLLQKSKNEYIRLFLQHTDVDIQRLKEFKKLKDKKSVQNLTKEIEKLDNIVSNYFKDTIYLDKIIVSVIFVIAVIVLLILIKLNKTASRLKDELQEFKTAIENSYNSIILTDKDNKIIYINETVEVDTLYTKDELIGQDPSILKSKFNNIEFYKELNAHIKSGKRWFGEIISQRKDGQLLYEKTSIIPIFREKTIVNYLYIKLNITDYVKQKQKIEYMAYHDSLTHLPNRAYIEKYLQENLMPSLKLAIIFIDLDRFKTINDTLGHRVGDELLIKITTILQNVIYKDDILARVGGDEFIILSQFEDRSSIEDLCKNILEKFTKPIVTQHHTLNITASIGISLYPDDELDIQKLLKYADIAMYDAKDSGKNRFKFYKQNLSVLAHNRLEIEQALGNALENGEFSLVYQPKYDLVFKKTVGLEALIRWNNKVLGFVSPDKFIPISEDMGVIIDIGLFVFKKACEDFVEFKKHTPYLKTISINVSTVQLYENSFIDNILAILKEVKIEPNEIKIEITETHIMKNLEQSLEVLEKLKRIGFDISIDDFGTGHSSLSYLKLFPIDELKIDKAFIDDIPDDKGGVAITNTIITLSKNMDYVNVAEGIETKEQEEFLEEAGCEIGQGYYFSKPQTKESLIEFLKEEV